MTEKSEAEDADDGILSPADEIYNEVIGGDLEVEHAMLKLLVEIANGIWALSADVSDLLEMAQDDGTERARMH